MDCRTIFVGLLAAVLLGPSTVSAMTTYQDVLDTPATLSEGAAHLFFNGVAVAGKRVVGVGQRGYIVFSDNRGQNWTQGKVPVSSDLLAVHFTTPLQGWAVGHDGVVLHSADGGATWSKQLDGRAAARIVVDMYQATAPDISSQPGSVGTTDLPDDLQRLLAEGPDKPFLDVWFKNETNGFIVGAFGLILHTTDAGKSWSSWYDRIDNPLQLHLYAICPLGTDLFIAAEQGTLFKLDQKADRFREIKTPYDGTFFGITGKQDAMIAFGMRGNAYISRSGGASWQKVETRVPVGLTGGTVIADGQIVLVSQGGHVLLSNDNGSSIRQIKIDQPFPAAAVAAIDKDTLVLAGPNGMKIQPIK